MFGEAFAVFLAARASLQALEGPQHTLPALPAARAVAAVPGAEPRSGLPWAGLASSFGFESTAGICFRRGLYGALSLFALHGRPVSECVKEIVLG